MNEAEFVDALLQTDIGNAFLVNDFDVELIIELLQQKRQNACVRADTFCELCNFFALLFADDVRRSTSPGLDVVNALMTFYTLELGRKLFLYEMLREHAVFCSAETWQNLLEALISESDQSKTELEQICPKILTFVHILRTFSLTNYACLRWYEYAVAIVRAQCGFRVNLLPDVIAIIDGLTGIEELNPVEPPRLSLSEF